MAHLKQNHLKINLDNCFFRNKEVSYIGFTLSMEGIEPGCKDYQIICQPMKFFPYTH